ncbi:hypothetical protein ACUOA8_18660 [Escherichia sp. SS-MK2]
MSLVEIVIAVVGAICVAADNVEFISLSLQNYGVCFPARNKNA